MVEVPAVLVVAKDAGLVTRVVRNLNAHGLAAFGFTSSDEALRAIKTLRPEVVVVDPTGDQCLHLLENMNAGRKPLALVALVPDEEAAQKARDMGIEEIILSDESGAVVDAVLERVVPNQPALAYGEGARILVVDDEDEMRDILSSVLTHQGYTVVEAESGKQALERVDQDPGINVVLLDVVMPDLGGIETLRELKRKHPQVVVILVSAVVDAEIAKQAQKLGAFDYMTKPLDYGDLKERIIAGMAAAEYHHQPWWKRLG